MAASDAELAKLMLLALEGDRQAYNAVLQETSRFLRPYLSRRINTSADTEEVLQEILLSIHKSRHTFDGKRPYRPWAFAIARFRLQDYLRKIYADHLRHAGDLEEAEQISAGDVTNSPLTYELIKDEIAGLPGKQPAILHLLHSEGHTSKEVAQKMNMTESAVKVAAHRAYKALRKKLAG
ncbi:MAG TPA: sigma-70 family RNA polymerase sigma factor [Rickettsiales bacterium]|nr:sigma-70 family RNA polymerase sigma factor [Rickettsiales bacterium]